MDENQERLATEEDFDVDVDRFPVLEEVIRQLAGDEDLSGGPFQRVEVHGFANGAATYRVWLPRTEEPESGYIPPE